MATLGASSPASTTLSALVRRVLVEGSNKPIRMNALWEALRRVDPSLTVTKSHFKKRVVAGMFHREEVRFAGCARARARVCLCAACQLGWRTLCAAPLRRPQANHHHLPTRAQRTPPRARTHTQLVKVRVVNPNWDAERIAAHLAAGGGPNHLVYAMRLKGSAKVNRSVQRQGLAVDVRALGALGAAAPLQ
jgi:hypothetical protein